MTLDWPHETKVTTAHIHVFTPESQCFPKVSLSPSLLCVLVHLNVLQAGPRDTPFRVSWMGSRDPLTLGRAEEPDVKKRAKSSTTRIKTHLANAHSKKQIYAANITKTMEK